MYYCNYIEVFLCYYNIYRVASLSYKIAKECINCGEIRIAYISGLVHDVLDSKLITEKYDKNLIENELRVLLLNKEKCTLEQIEIIINITKTVGYSKRLKLDYNTNQHLFSNEYKAVQDADLLDAIGCIGIARCYTYGGKKCKPIFGVGSSACEHITYDYYINKQQNDGNTANATLNGTDATSTSTNSSTEHFFEKLLRIKSLLITPLGKKMGEKRHENMIQYLLLLRDELCDGVDDVSNHNMSAVSGDKDNDNTTVDNTDKNDNGSGDQPTAKKQRRNNIDNMDKIEMFEYIL